MEDKRKYNSGVIGNKGGGGWTAINREMWTNLKNEAIRQALEALTGTDTKFKQAVVLKMLDKCTDVGELAGKLELIIKENDDSEVIQTEPLAAEGSTG